MTFLQPALALAALVVAGLPVLLHLLLRRPRATEWPSTMLLRRAIERLRRRRRLEQWVLLALRALALALAGLGMAGPVARTLNAVRGTRELWIVIDDGATSAERLPDGTRAIDRSRAGALEAMRTLASGDRVAIVTAARPVETRLQPTVDLERARREIEALQPRPVAADLASAIERCLPAQGDADAPREALVASSFRRGSVEVETPLPPAWAERSTRVRWTSLRPLEDVRANRSVAGVRVGRGPGEMTGTSTAPVRVDLERSGAEAGSDPLLVRSSAGDLLGRADASWTAGSTGQRVDIEVRAPKDGAFIVEAGADAQPLDDSVAAVSPVTGPPRVCVIGRRAGDADLERLPSSTWILRALDSAGVQAQEVDPSTLALRPPRDVETIIVTRADLVDAAGWAWIGQFTRDGGTTVLMPVVGLASQAWFAEARRAMAIEIDQAATPETGSFRLAARQPRSALLSLLGAEVDALAEPVSVQARWPLQVSSEATSVLAFEDGSPAMCSGRPRDGVGLAVVLATAPEIAVTDLPLKPLMVPLFQEIARAGRVVASAQQVCSSGETGWMGSAAAGGLLRSSDGATVIEIDGEGRTARAVPHPGLWKLEQRDGRQRWIAVRLDPRAASIDRVEPAAFEAWHRGLGAWSSQGEEGGESRADAPATDSPWTIPLVGAALVALLSECAWSRRGSPRQALPQGAA